MEYGLLAKEVALHIGINPNTLRRWAIEIEKNGYEFERNTRGQRIFYERDRDALSKMKIILANNESLENAGKCIATTINKTIQDKENVEKTLSVIRNKDKNNEIYAFTKEELQTFIGETVEEHVKKAIEEEREAMFKAFDRRMNDVIERRDQQMISEMRRSLNEGKKETSFDQEQKQDLSFFRKLFKRNK
ncbi:hypothetical protein [Shouchella patagoniensis]|uniref:hypothetical protein n=1 Tax=Shouchella patagoniensis TaxID=228576 RepID=UPI000994E4AF|nr:hypothetical protein [Shouchella patagoniensis]